MHNLTGLNTILCDLLDNTVIYQKDIIHNMNYIRIQWIRCYFIFCLKKACGVEKYRECLYIFPVEQIRVDVWYFDYICPLYQEIDDGTEPTNTLYLSYIHHIYTTLLEISVIYQEIDDGTEPTNTLRLSYIHHIRYTVKNSSHIVPY